MIKLLRNFVEEVIVETTFGSTPVRVANTLLGVLVLVVAAWIGYHVVADLRSVF